MKILEVYPQTVHLQARFIMPLDTHLVYRKKNQWAGGIPYNLHVKLHMETRPHSGPNHTTKYYTQLIFY